MKSTSSKETAPEKEPRKTGVVWFDNLPGGFQILLIVGGAGAGIAMIAFLFSLFSTEPRVKTQKLNLAPAAPTVVEPSQSDQQAASQEAWKRVGIAHTNTQQKTSELSDQIRAARAQAWVIEAQKQCQTKQGVCRNYYQYLVSAYDYWLSQMEEVATYKERLITTSGDTKRYVQVEKMVLDAKTTDRFRQIEATLNDIALALSWKPGEAVNSPGFVITSDFLKASKEFKEFTSNWESTDFAITAGSFPQTQQEEKK